MSRYGAKKQIGARHGRGSPPPADSGSGSSRISELAPPIRIQIQATGDVDKAIRDYLIQLLLQHHIEYQRPYLSFPYGGLPASAENFQFLTDPSRVDQAYEFAELANSIPRYDGHGRWYFTGNQLADEYAYWLDNFVPPQIKINKEEQKRLRKARKFCEKHFNEYWDYRTKFYNAQDEYEAWLHMPQSERPPDYDRQLRDSQARMDIARQGWEVRGYRTDFEIQYAIIVDLSRRDPALAKQTLRDALGKPIISSRGEFYWTSLLPSDAFAPDQQWLRYEIEFGTPAPVESGGGGPTLALLARKALDQYPYFLEDVALDGTRITFEMVRLAIDRGWFADYLLSSTAWKWADSTPANPLGGYPLSDGNPQPLGHLVMIPREVLFIRNKKVDSPGLLRALVGFGRAKPDVQPGHWLSLGPFGLWAPRAGGLTALVSEAAMEVESPSRFGKYLFETSNVEPTQLEYFAFLCELIPMEPNPDWKLWPPQ